MKKYALTIGRQYGSGGLAIAKLLSKSLSIPFYDKTLLQMAAQKSGLEENFIEKFDEDKNFLTATMFSDVFNSSPILYDSLFKIQSNIIRQLAKKDSAIFVGRCADYVLRDFPDCLNIFIYADEKDKTQRLVSEKSITQKEAQERIHRVDKDRAKYYGYYTQKIWGAINSYHLCVNSSVLGIDETACFIQYFVEKSLDKN
ncbi:MAG: cytidylate kinase-like family protein [Endomicrobium sp.]|nr:cytidylate kinase-like family protein [Endomicrobium sp.]